MRILLFVLAGSAIALAGVAPPMSFEPNEGQTHSSVQFFGRSVYLSPSRVAIHANGEAPIVMELVGARGDVHGEGLDAQSGVTNYFLGNDPAKWMSGIPHYGRVRFKELYPGIDVVYYGNQQGSLEFDFFVSAGADPSRIQLAYNQPLLLDRNGDLLIAGVRQRRPVVLQKGRKIGCSYRITGDGMVRLALAAYNPRRAMTVDPAVEYATYVGGPSYDYATSVQVDRQGNSYVAMSERAPTNPSLNPFQQVSGANYDAFVAKFDPTGKSLVYYTYLGGTGDTYANAIAIDSAGNIYLTGSTSALDLPTKSAAQATFGGGFNDAMVAKISADGRSVAYVTYLGGTNAEEGHAIALDSSGQVYVGGFTHSSDFPTQSPLVAYAGGQDGFLARLSADGKRFDLSTCIGGTGDDYVNGLTIDAAGFVYLAGRTSSSDFPTRNGLQTAGPGGTITSAAFVAKLAPSLSDFVYSTFLGGSAFTVASGVAADADGNAVVSGITDGPGLPATPSGVFQPSYGGGTEDVFVAKLNSSGSGLLFTTYIGGSDVDFQQQNSLGVDQAGNIYVTGFTYSADFPLKDSLQPFLSGNSQFKTNAFVVELSPAGQAIYSTLIGGHGDNRAYGLAVSATGEVYVAGYTTADDFPVKGPFQGTYGGSGDGFLLKLAAVNLQTQFAPNPKSLTFEFVQGGAVPDSQASSVSTGGPFVLMTESDWISAKPPTGITPATLAISVDPVGLSPQIYSSKVDISPQSGTAGPLPAVSIDVTLVILAAAPVLESVSPSFVPVGSGDATITLRGSGFAQSAIVQTTAGPWVDSPVTFVDSTTLRLIVPSRYFLGAGTLQFSVHNLQSAISGPQILTVGLPAKPVISLVANAFGDTPLIAPNTWVEIKGASLALPTSSRIWMDSDFANDRLPTQLDGVSVTLNGKAAYIYYISPTQVNIITPPDQLSGPISVQVVNNGIASDAVSVQSQAQSLSFFEFVPSSGLHYVYARHGSDNTLVGPTSLFSGQTTPVRPGESIYVAANGFGSTDIAVTSGSLTQSGTLPSPLPVVKVGGVQAKVSFAGLVGIGTYQINLAVPSNAPDGDLSLTATYNGLSIQPNLLITVQR